MNTIVASDGARIAWVERGEGRPVALIMGLGADHGAWEPHVAQWETSFRCLLIDNRGVGDSDAPSGPYTTERMADDVAEVLDASGVSSAAVAGISMGGAIAQQVALRHAHRVDKLILTASWAGMNPVSEDVFAELRLARMALSPGDFLRRLQLLIWSPRAYTERATQLRAERDDAVIGATPEGFSAQVDACVGHDTRRILHEITVPTLVTAGLIDVFTPIAASAELAALIPDATIEVFSGGHAHHWEELNRFNRVCEEFLQ